jgi:uncharacterized membrane protein
VTRAVLTRAAADRIVSAMTISPRVHGWHHHPAVRSDHQLTLGERAADAMRNGMGSWIFVFCALAFLAVWMLFNGDHGFDKYPFILLNLVLSCLAALQGAILLIAARRSDHIASELAEHDYDTDRHAAELIERITTGLDALSRQHAEMQQQMAELTELVRSQAPQARA